MKFIDAAEKRAEGEAVNTSAGDCDQCGVRDGDVPRLVALLGQAREALVFANESTHVMEVEWSAKVQAALAAIDAEEG